MTSDVRPDAESVHLAATEAALTDDFPDVPRAHVHELVMDAYRSLADARIRDFLPLLIRRAVRDRISGERRAREVPTAG